jgi:DHA1 family bicyclomycin/chloramphenicol resistance-like MFS transporter
MINKTLDFKLLAMIALMNSTVCMETDIYGPAFTDMKAFFLTTPEAIQRILSINFIGLCLGSLFFGPLLDSYGRQKILRLGLAVFAFSSWACLIAHNFMLIIRDIMKLLAHQKKSG